MLRPRALVKADHRLSERQTILVVVWVLVVMAVFLAFSYSAWQNRPIHYKHSLNYPAYQQRELIQVGSLDRG